MMALVAARGLLWKRCGGTYPVRSIVVDTYSWALPRLVLIPTWTAPGKLSYQRCGKIRRVMFFLACFLVNFGVPIYARQSHIMQVRAHQNERRKRRRKKRRTRRMEGRGLGVDA